MIARTAPSQCSSLVRVRARVKCSSLLRVRARVTVTVTVTVTVRVRGRVIYDPNPYPNPHPNPTRRCEAGAEQAHDALVLQVGVHAQLALHGGELR